MHRPVEFDGKQVDFCEQQFTAKAHIHGCDSGYDFVVLAFILVLLCRMRIVDSRKDCMFNPD
jgi:hypothetical protein